MLEAEKDIILVLGDGGMMGVFVAGVLAGLDEKIRNRVCAVYGTSSGADVGAYFVSGQSDIPLRFFVDYLTKPDFCRKNFLRYLFKLFIFRNSAVKDYLNVGYVAEVAQYSDCKLDVAAFEKSDMEFHVKVINIRTAKVHYIPAKSDVFNKLMASSQCGPLSTKAVEIDGNKYIDGGTIPSRIDITLSERHPDKKIIFVQPQKQAYVAKVLLHPLYLLAGHAISILYGRHLGREYARTLFVDYTPELRSRPNVIFVENDLRYSSFCTDKKKLRSVYERGLGKTTETLRRLQEIV
jgi:predicted patatin/cPLA2 family phospholipase